MDTSLSQLDDMEKIFDQTLSYIKECKSLKKEMKTREKGILGEKTEEVLRDATNKKAKKVGKNEKAKVQKILQEACTNYNNQLLNVHAAIGNFPPITNKMDLDERKPEDSWTHESNNVVINVLNDYRTQVEDKFKNGTINEWMLLEYRINHSDEIIGNQFLWTRKVEEYWFQCVQQSQNQYRDGWNWCWELIANNSTVSQQQQKNLLLQMSQVKAKINLKLVTLETYIKKAIKNIQECFNSNQREKEITSLKKSFEKDWEELRTQRAQEKSEDINNRLWKLEINNQNRKSTHSETTIKTDKGNQILEELKVLKIGLANLEGTVKTKSDASIYEALKGHLENALINLKLNIDTELKNLKAEFDKEIKSIRDKIHPLNTWNQAMEGLKLQCNSKSKDEINKLRRDLENKFPGMETLSLKFADKKELSDKNSEIIKIKAEWKALEQIAKSDYNKYSNILSRQSRDEVSNSNFIQEDRYPRDKYPPHDVLGSELLFKINHTTNRLEEFVVKFLLQENLVKDLQNTVGKLESKISDLTALAEKTKGNYCSLNQEIKNLQGSIQKMEQSILDKSKNKLGKIKERLDTIDSSCLLLFGCAWSKQVYKPADYHLNRAIFKPISDCAPVEERERNPHTQMFYQSAKISFEGIPHPIKKAEERQLNNLGKYEKAFVNFIKSSLFKDHVFALKHFYGSKWCEYLQLDDATLWTDEEKWLFFSKRG